MRHALVFAVVVTVTLLLLPASVQARYTDGMNLYEYVKASPLERLDPSGRVVIGLWGVDLWGREVAGQDTITKMVGEIARKLRTLRIDPGKEVKASGTYFNRPNVENEMRQWVQRIKGKEHEDPRCWEPFILFGFSDGATTIWRTIRQHNNGNYFSALLDVELGRTRNPAFIGLIDMARRWFMPIPGLAWIGEPPNFESGRPTKSEVNKILARQPTFVVNWRGNLRDADNPSILKPETFRGFRIKGGKVFDRPVSAHHKTILAKVRSNVVGCAVEAAQVVKP